MKGAGHTLEAVAAHCDDVEGTVEVCQLRMRGEVGVPCAGEPALLLGADHLEGVAVALAALALDLDEDESPAAADDEVELVPARPDVRCQDAVPAQPVVPERAQLRGVLQAASPW
jgi:hypothetical protein